MKDRVRFRRLRTRPQRRISIGGTGKDSRRVSASRDDFGGTVEGRAAKGPRQVLGRMFWEESARGINRGFLNAPCGSRIGLSGVALPGPPRLPVALQLEALPLLVARKSGDRGNGYSHNRGCGCLSYPAHNFLSA
jgi:hypothetical protein